MASAGRRARKGRHVVAGAAGFLGSHLVDYLLARGETVVGIDNLITGQPRNLAAAMENPRFHFIQHNVSEPFFLVEPVRYVWHLASPASPPDYFKNPIHTMKVGALGTLNLLGIARKHGARFFLASTSEVYGDPEVSPQPEAYWGRVNPIGPRSVYDEAKRFAEALTMAYHREHGVDTRIVRIFNSVLADETIFLFNDEACHLQSAESYANSLEARKVWAPLHIQVPAFDPATCAVQLRPASAFIKHPAVAKDAYLVRTRYGRHIKVTGDHSLFKRDRHGRPAAAPVRELAPGDYVAIPSRLPVVERDVRSINVGQWLLHTTPDHERLSGYVLISPRLPETIVRHKALVYDTLMRSARFEGSRRRRNTVGCAYRKYLRRGALPLAVVAELRRQVGFEWPSDARLARYTGGGSATIPNLVEVSDELLWLLGFYLAEGCCYTKNGTRLLTFCSDERFLLRAKALLEEQLGVRVGFVPASGGRGPTIYAHSRLLCELITGVFGLRGASARRRVPSWVFQLPLSRLKHFLEGYREGDRSHTNVDQRRELAFNTSSEALATDLVYVLLRFGIVASLGRYETTFKQRYGERRFPFWRLTVCELSNFDVLTWDGGVRQTLKATRTGDLVWAQVTAIEPTEVTPYVYDLAVPGCENFLAGTGVFAHNTYGPRMRLDDGRVVPNFIGQALRGEPLTVYGDGSQTRSFCYVDDEVEGLYRLMMSSEVLPTNIGNPREMTILEFARAVQRVAGKELPIVFKPLPQDDPRQRRPDITKAKRVLGWEPKVDLEDGLRRTFEWFRTQG